MKRENLNLAPWVRNPSQQDFEKYPIRDRFARLFVENLERASFGSTIHTVFSAMVVAANADNLVNITGLKLAEALSIPIPTVYKIIARLEQFGAIVRIKKSWWMIDPSIVYSGPSKYHRATKMQFRIFVDQKQKDKSPTNHERNDDEQCDLQTRSGDPDPAHDAARAECA